jgi:hypothetical protein
MSATINILNNANLALRQSWDDLDCLDALDTGPPGRKRKAPTLACNPGSHLQLAVTYQQPELAQARFVSSRREAARLAREYLHTGWKIHRMAFERSVDGMFLRMRKSRA